MRHVILETIELGKSFGAFEAVAGVSLQVKEGSTHALIGPNGAGKTTLFNLLTKFVQPSRGRIIFAGQDITAAKPDAVAKVGLVRSFQISSVFSEQTVLENVRLALQRRRGESFDFWRSEDVLRQYDDEADSLLEQVDLLRFRKARAGDLSYGRKRALEIATTIALNPKLMLLDEPMAGMTEEDVQRNVELIRRVRVGRTVLIVEHNLSVVKDLCDRVTVLSRGKVMTEGDYQTVSQHPEVLTAYLGDDA
ncbi:ABC transporter ATP-binding protein [Rhizobium sp. Root149]|uniref:ABC transporter ATP-binding protein n=1 Tax=Rhizobium sp. Root149 TaxID=1736473 RepID=UPI0012E35C79|nr:ABC transporter ATP-binding protein [Rhizobium sp. Root149]